MRLKPFAASPAGNSSRSPDVNTGRADVVFGNSWMAVHIMTAVNCIGEPSQVKRSVTRSPRGGSGSEWRTCTPPSSLGVLQT